MSRKKPDYYYYKAKEEGYPSRAVYKLIQLDQRFHLLRSGQIVVDLCGAPGGFATYAAKKVGSRGRVFVVDLEPLSVESPRITYIKADINKKELVLRLKKEIIEKYPNKDMDRHGVDIVIADCSPSVMGSWTTDHARQIYLAEMSLSIARDLKAPCFVTKVFDGEFLSEFLELVKQEYSSVKQSKPRASRATAAERYVIARQL